MSEDNPVLIDPSTGQPITQMTLKPERVEERVRRRKPQEYEEASKKFLRYAQLGRTCHWPANVVDDMVLGAMLLAEVYVAKREGIISDK